MSNNEEMCKTVEEFADNLQESDKKDQVRELENFFKIINDNAAKGDGADVSASNEGGECTNKVDDLEHELKKTTNERDDYHKQLAETEKRLTDLQTSYDIVTKTGGDDINLRIEIEDLKNKLIQSQLQLEQKTRTIVNQENQINALNKQVNSLKEVVQITKDLLNIRNMEVKHLQQDVDSMESKISAEKERHNAMLTKMDTAVRLNEDLKKEYETQLRLFHELRSQYEKKMTLLSEENKALESATESLKSSI